MCFFITSSQSFSFFALILVFIYPLTSIIIQFKLSPQNLILFPPTLVVSPSSPVKSLPSLPISYQTYFYLFPLPLLFPPSQIFWHCYFCYCILNITLLLHAWLTLGLSISSHTILPLSTSTCLFTLDIHVTFPTHSSASFTIFSKWTLLRRSLSNYLLHLLTNFPTCSTVPFPNYQKLFFL